MLNNDTLSHNNYTISKVKSQYTEATHKLGEQQPHSVAEAPELIKGSDNELCLQAIQKEFNKVIVAF